MSRWTAREYKIKMFSLISGIKVTFLVINSTYLPTETGAVISQGHTQLSSLSPEILLPIENESSSLSALVIRDLR